MCVQALTNVVIVASGFYDYMHCTSVHVVIPVRVCAESTESEVMVAHRVRWGSGLFGLAACCGELGIGGFKHGQRFSQVL